MDMQTSTHCHQKHSDLCDFLGLKYRWAKSSPESYEVSSAGDRRFSAFNAILVVKNGNTWNIETYYQIITKGYHQQAKDSGIPFKQWWKIGKSKSPLNNKSSRELYVEYLEIWRRWSVANPELFHELSILADGKVLTDKFATTEVNQAHALCDLLNEKYGNFD